MPHSVGRPSPDSSSAKRLVDAAAEVFAREGYHGARVRDIVKLAGTNLAAVNYHFGGKERLYAATLTELAAARAGEWPQGLPDEEPEKALFLSVKAAIERFLQVMDRSTLARIIAHESLKPTPHIDNLVTEIIRPQLEHFAELAMRIGNGELTPEQANAAAASILGQCSFYLFVRPAIQRIYPSFLDPGNVDALARHITTFTIGGIHQLVAAARK